MVARLSVRAVRNLGDLDVGLAEGVTLVLGPNGAGKSSLLEALYLALTGRSWRTRREREAIAFGAELARAEADVVDAGERRRFLWSTDRSGERRHLLDGAPLQGETGRLRPAIAVFVPDRLALVKGPPSSRRAHLDGLCGALWPARSELRRRYGRALAQRNSLVGRIRAGASSPASLDAWDLELAQAGLEVMSTRAEAVERLAPAFAAAASDLALGEAALAYRPRSRASATSDLVAELHERRESDLARGHSGHGPHLDELEIGVGGRAVRRYGSQGEQRAALLALLLAERRCLIEAGQSPPLMLLDDVMSELDSERRTLLGSRLLEGGGQALITATEAGQLPAEIERTELRLRAGRVLGAVAERAA